MMYDVPSAFKDRISKRIADLSDEVVRIEASAPGVYSKADQAAADARFDELYDSFDPFTAYQNAAGEMRARATQGMKDFSPQEVLELVGITGDVDKDLYDIPVDQAFFSLDETPIGRLYNATRGMDAKEIKDLTTEQIDAIIDNAVRQSEEPVKMKQGGAGCKTIFWRTSTQVRLRLCELWAAG
jgi:hypothetical protein